VRSGDPDGRQKRAKVGGQMIPRALGISLCATPGRGDTPDVAVLQREQVVRTANNGLVDYARFVAALAIVWLNVDVPGSWLASVAFPLFLVLLFADHDASVRENADRYLKPFLIWTVLYGLLSIAFAVKAQNPALQWWDWKMLVVGTWFHLWVLPFAFFASLLAPWFRHPLASLGAAVLVAALLLGRGPSTGEAWQPWSFGAIPVLVAIGFAAWGWRLAATTLGLCFAVLYLEEPSPENLTVLAGTAIALIIMSYRLPASPLSAQCARLSLSIYLAHPLITIVGQSLRITWVELGLFSIVGSVIFAVIIDTVTRGGEAGRGNP
jgi:hypothetical protein